MGRATIVSGGTDGYYAVNLIKNLTRATANISKLAASISDLSSKISDLTTDLNTAEGELIAARAALSAVINTGTTTEKMEATKTVLEKQSVVNQINQSIARLRLQKTQMEKQKSILEDAISTDTRNVWCADLTENLSGEVGTIEVNGLGTQIIIMPAGDTGEAIGKLQSPIANTPTGAAYNLALLPWWQKFKPTYRIGVIICIPSSVEGAEADTCDVAILPVWGMQGINVNQAGDGEYWIEMDAPQGTVDFCLRHPTHPICVTTEDVRIDLTSENWAAMVSVNAEVNGKMEYEYDQAQYEKLEHWEIPDDSGTTYKGDCEDMALLKMQKLITAGFPAGCMKIVAGTMSSGQDHAFLLILTNSGDYALDINFSSPRLVGDLPYYDMYWQKDGVWGQNCIRLNNVPIEYMTCNAYAFSPGDRVVVAFDDQDWTKPTVIGFETNPAPCEAFYVFGGYSYYDGYVSHGQRAALRYSNNQDIWVERALQSGAARYLFPSLPHGNRAYSITGQICEDYESWDPGGVPPWILECVIAADEYNLALDLWASITDYPGHSRRAAAGIYSDTEIYIGNGTYDTWNPDGHFNHPYPQDYHKYNPTLQSWATGPTSAFKRQLMGCASLNNIGYFMGGFYYEEYTGVLWHYGYNICYNTTTGSWSSRTDVPYPPRHGIAATAIGINHIFVAGGGGLYGQPLAAYLYTVSSQTWHQCPDASVLRISSASGAIEYKAYVAGGGLGLETLDSCEYYDATAMTWNNMGSMPAGREAPGGCVI